MLRQRVITALVLAAFFLGALFGASANVFLGLMALLVACAAWEWSALAAIESGIWRGFYVLLMVGLVAAMVFYFRFDSRSLFEPRISVLLSWAAGWWALALLWVQSYPASTLLWGRSWVCVVMGVMVLLPTWVAMAVLIYAPYGPWLVLGIVVLVALADIGAFFTGRAFGRHKLAVTVSPGKTWEGLGGGIGAITVAVLVFVALVAPGGHWWAWLLLALITGLASVLGDLLESMIKRHRGVKDSGTILPGHGGILDRIDSLTAALPVFTLLYSLLYQKLW